MRTPDREVANSRRVVASEPVQPAMHPHVYSAEDGYVLMAGRSDVRIEQEPSEHQRFRHLGAK
eukprot:3992467-Alexandrium_andersonii.AAC.1